MSAAQEPNNGSFFKIEIGELQFNKTLRLSDD